MSLKTNADALLRKRVESGDVPGVVAAATDANGTIYEGAFGVRTLGEPVSMTPDTVVWIASVTKALTGTAAMQRMMCAIDRSRVCLPLVVARMRACSWHCISIFSFWRS